MHDIDFLPAEHRQRYARRRMLVWRHAISVVIGVAICASALYQQHAFRSVRAQLAAVSPKYDLARQQTDRLDQLQTELNAATAEADLVTYLRYPWPRTQLLAELLQPLPDDVTFTAVDISLRQPPAAPATSRSLATEKPQGEKIVKELPSVEDLKSLRQQRDQARTIVTIEGLTTDTDALHRYLGRLNNGTLFSNAELESLDVEDAGDKSKVLHFIATLQVEPAYGVPGGPVAPPTSVIVGLEPASPPASEETTR